MSTARLSVREVTVRYGGVVAVDRVSFDIAPGTVHGLIGPNGAGKTSLIDAISGYTKCTGTVLLDGQDITGMSAYRRARCGVGRTFQSIELFDDLTVAENVLVGSYRGLLSGTVGEILRLRQRPAPSIVNELLEHLGISEFADRPVEDLSAGHRKLVSVARTLAADPQVILLDEPAAGLDSSESLELGVVLRGLANHGHTVLLVDHDMTLVLGICDHVEVIDFGRGIASAPPEDIRHDPRVIDAYLAQDDSVDAVLLDPHSAAGTS